MTDRLEKRTRVSFFRWMVGLLLTPAAAGVGYCSRWLLRAPVTADAGCCGRRLLLTLVVAGAGYC